MDARKKISAAAKKIAYKVRKGRTKKEADWYPECPVCHHRSLMMSGESSFEDFGRDDDGIVAMYDCGNCGCYVEAWVSFEKEE